MGIERRKQEQCFTCWKEIATYLGKGVRTVQRWEQDLGLPIRRPNGQEHPNKIIALRSELDAWRASQWPRRRSGVVGVGCPLQRQQESNALSEKDRDALYDLFLAQSELMTNFITVVWNTAEESRRRSELTLAERVYRAMLRLKSSLKIEDKTGELNAKLAFLELALSQVSRNNANNLREAIVNLEYLMNVTQAHTLRQQYQAKLTEYRARLHLSLDQAVQVKSMD